MKVTIRPEFGCHPLWLQDSDDVAANVPPEDLGLPTSLCNQLRQWAACYELTFCDEYPPDSGFASSIDEAAFALRGRELAHMVAGALPEAEVAFSFGGREWRDT